MKALFYQIRVSLRIKIWPSVACARLVGHHASVYAVPLEVNFDPLWSVPAIAGCLTTAVSHLTRSHGNPMRLNRVGLSVAVTGLMEHSVRGLPSRDR